MNYDLIRIPLEKQLANHLYELIEGDIMKSILKEAKIERFENEWKLILEGHSFKVTRELASGLYELFHEVQNRLGFEEAIDFYVTNSPQVNAFALPAIEEGDANMININSGLIEQMDDDELRFVIGHEIGHLISKNATISRLLQFVYPVPEKIPALVYHKINLWNKLSELTADRYGYIASPKLDKCLSNFFKISSGLNPGRINFDHQAYLSENDRIIDYFKENRGQNLASHPINPIRIKALLAFSESELYKKIVSGEELVEDETLSNNVQEMLGILMTLTSSELDQHRINFMVSSGLMVAGVDDEVSQEEVERIMDIISKLMLYPKEMVERIYSSGKVPEIFNGSASVIMNQNPGERYNMFDYMAGIAMSDHEVFQQEVDFLYKAAEFLNLTRKEAAQIIAQNVQREFIPNIYG